ncbi:MAG: glycosyltransferase [Flavobacterium sp.]|nr:glycosyltransferase [Flavobacterium sp.]
MISILIPTYDYDITKLVHELVKQCQSAQIVFEIICQDDDSKSDLNLKNNSINSIEFCHFYSNSENFGRSKNRNTLAQKSNYDWLLFLDCDMIPVSENFIQNYVKTIDNCNSEIVFGGVEYQANRPPKAQLLRWVYGKKRETKSVEQRTKSENISTLTSNFLIKKDLLIAHPFDEQLTEYGFEDYAFFSALEKEKKEVKHIDNPCFHNGLETSSEFLSKTKMAIQNLVYLSNHKNTLVKQTELVRTYQKISRLQLQKMVILFFNVFKKSIEKNLSSNFPSLFLFDLYKLGWYCVLMRNQALK